MKIFFKAYLASLLAGVTFIMLLFASLLFVPKEEKINVRENSILHLKLNRPIVDNAHDDPFANFDFMAMESTTMLGLNDLKAALKHAKSDDKIKGVFLDIGIFSAGISTLKELRNAILDFKESDKFVYSYGDIYSQGAYYLASAADSVFVNPSGFFEFVGMASSQPYLKGLFDKVGVEPVVIRGSNNKFKSAVEPYLSKEMSEANRTQLTALLGDLWGELLADISKSRGISVAKLQRYADSLDAFLPIRAVELGLMDKLAFRTDVMERFKIITEAKSVRRIPKVSIAKYLKATPKSEAKDEIAVIYAEGEIGMTEGGQGQIGPKTYVEAVQKAANDDDVKAVVLRVNSPGGSALTSDIIHHELLKLKVKKPLIVSMGNYAASGGYFISAPADKIVAQPTTITGSIGVFMLTFTAKKFLQETADVKFETVKTAAMADLGNLGRDITDAEYKTIQRSVDHTYGMFIQKVKNGRGLDSLYIDSIGQGRVWTGTRAKELGLVDELGGLDRALELAAEAAEIDNYKIKVLPETKNTVEQLLESFSMEQAKEEMLQAELGEFYGPYKTMQQMRKNQGMMARMPYSISIQ